MVVSQIKPVDLENLQAKRRREGNADATIDQELSKVKVIINKAFDNDMISTDTLKSFRVVKPLLRKKNANARDRILTPREYQAFLRAPLLISKAFLQRVIMPGCARVRFWDPLGKSLT